MTAGKPEHLTKKRSQEIGANYTPKELCKLLCDKFQPEGLNKKELKKWWSKQTIIDPCGGLGYIIKEAMSRGLKGENSYIVDIDQETVDLCWREFNQEQDMKRCGCDMRRRNSYKKVHIKCGDILNQADEIMNLQSEFWKNEKI